MIIAWKGWGLLALIIVAACYFGISRLSPELLLRTGGGVVGVSLCLAAILMIPLAVYDFMIYRRDKVVQNSAFFIPLYIFPIVVLVLGIVFYKT